MPSVQHKTGFLIEATRSNAETDTWNGKFLEKKELKFEDKNLEKRTIHKSCGWEREGTFVLRTPDLKDNKKGILEPRKQPGENGFKYKPNL